MDRSWIIAALCMGAGLAPQAACSAPSPGPANMPAGVYVIDRLHASIVAKLSHMGFSSYTLRFLRFDGAYTYDPARPAASKLKVTIDPASIDTATGGDSFGRSFDAQLAGDGWLETRKFPTATFVSTVVDVGDGHRGRVTGDLTLHGVTRPVTLDVTFNGSGLDIISRRMTSGFSATTVIRRSQFGITQLIPGVGDEVTLDIEVEFQKQ